jgi:hypothetical protein
MGNEALADVLDRLGDVRFRRRTAGIRQRLEDQDPEEVLWSALLESLGFGGNREPFRVLSLRLPWRKTPPALVWRSAGVRPGNHGARRLAAAAHLAARYTDAGLIRGLGAVLGQSVSDAIASLVAKDGGRTLIGAGRAVEILTNAVLPVFAASAREPGAGRAVELYRGLPRPARYGSLRHLDEAVGRGVSVNARRQQGMLHLLRNYCKQGRCGSCPLS